MPGKVTLIAIQGPLQGSVFSFVEHDTFIFGRSRDCHARLSKDDRTASRHHFLLEVDPPAVCVRDLGSKNGTFVNDRPIGRRASGESPGQAQQREHPTVPLSHGDRLRVGHTVFELSAAVLLGCADCGVSLGRYAPAGQPPRVPLLCEACRLRPRPLDHRPDGDDDRTRLQCPHCRRPAERGLLCAACRAQGLQDPVGFLMSAAPAVAEAAGLGLAAYRMGRELGRGGMGSVVQATRIADGQTVAIKVMLARVAADDAARRMFAREIETTRALRHPHIVEFIESGSAGDAFYVVLEYCSAGSLADMAERRLGRLPLSELGPWMMDALSGLAHAHRSGFVHRDIKPHNILLTQAGGRLVAKVADMGLSKSFAKAGLSGMTATGGFAGSFRFMPAEQLTNFKFAQPSGDVWSMAATFYQLLTGQSPRPLRPGRDPLAEILQAESVPIARHLPDIPPALAALFDRCLAREPEARPASAVEMRAELGASLGLS